MSAWYPLVEELERLVHAFRRPQKSLAARIFPQPGQHLPDLRDDRTHVLIGSYNLNFAEFDFIGCYLKDVAGGLGDADAVEFGPFSRE